MTRPAKGTQTSSLNIRVTARTRATLERLRDQTDAESMSEVIRKSVKLYEYTINHQITLLNVDKELVII